MNNRIQELINECTETLRGYDYRRGNYTETCFDKTKFAELIVRECAKVSERTGALNEADYEGEMIADAIKEHFGVDL